MTNQHITVRDSTGVELAVDRLLDLIMHQWPRERILDITGLWLWMDAVKGAAEEVEYQQRLADAGEARRR